MRTLNNLDNNYRVIYFVLIIFVASFSSCSQVIVNTQGLSSDSARSLASSSQAVLSEWRESLPGTFSSSVVSMTETNSMNPDVVMNASGDVLIAWMQSDGLNQLIYKSERISGVWTHPSSLDDSIALSIGSAYFYATAALSDTGQAAVTWVQYTGVRYKVFVATKDDGVWTTPSDSSDSISLDYPGNSSAIVYPEIDINASGDIILVWCEYSYTDSNYQIFKAERISGVWSKPSSFADFISPSGSSATSSGSQHSAIINDSGDVLVAWEQKNASNETQVFIAEKVSGVWSTPSNTSDHISPAGQNAKYPELEMNNSGDVVVAWNQSNGTNQQIFLSEKISGTWTHPSNVSDNISFNGEDCIGAEVDINSSGDVIVAWRQSDGANQQTFISERISGTWTHPSSLTDNISPDGQDTNYPEVAINDSGDAVVTWWQSDGTNDQIFISEKVSGTWTHPSSLSDNISPDGPGASDMIIAMSNTGDVVVAWNQTGDSSSQIFFSERVSGSWTHPSSVSDSISPMGYGIGPTPAVAVNSSGDAIIVWSYSDGSNSQIFKAERTNGTWTHPSGLSDNISPDGQNASSSRVAINDNGDVLITWYQSDGSDNQIFKSEKINGTWTHPSSLADNISPDGEASYTPELVLNNSGDALIAWYQQDGSDYQVFMSEKISGTWTHPSSLSDNISPDGESASSVALDMNESGDALIFWRQYNGSKFQAFLSERVSGTWTHPSNIADTISPSSQHTYNGAVAINDQGNAIVAWVQRDASSDYQVFISERVSGTWTHPSSTSDNISPDGEDAASSSISLALNNSDEAVLIWLQKDASSNYQVFMSEKASGAWVHPSSLADNISAPVNEGSASSAKLAMDETGDAIIVWSSDYNLYDYRREAGVWSSAAAIGNETIAVGYSLGLAPNASVFDPLIVYSTRIQSGDQVGLRTLTLPN